MAGLAIHRVTKQFGDHRAGDDLSLEIAPGERAEPSAGDRPGAHLLDERHAADGARLVLAVDAVADQAERRGELARRLPSDGRTPILRRPSGLATPMQMPLPAGCAFSIVSTNLCSPADIS